MFGIFGSCYRTAWAFAAEFEEVISTIEALPQTNAQKMATLSAEAKELVPPHGLHGHGRVGRD